MAVHTHTHTHTHKCLIKEQKRGDRNVTSY